MLRSSRPLAFVAVSLGLCACAAISGLGEYTDQLASDGGKPHSGSQTGAGQGAGDDGDMVSPDGASSGTSESGSAASGSSESGSSGEGVGEASSGAQSDDGSSGDTGQSGRDASSGTDAPPADAAVDAAATCHEQCGGCCDSDNVCHGGQSTATCGVNGQACVDCSKSSKVCSSAGACVASSQVDAGPAKCSATSCSNRCPLLEGPCCKTDGTCGCAVLGLLLCN